MIIQIRGTSGSGKSTVVREIMAWVGLWNSVRVDGRKRPLYYVYEPQVEGKGWPTLYVLGHYESPCGGCDTIGSARQVYELITSLPEGSNILCEGLLLSEDVKWSKQLPDLRVLFLTTPLETCLKQIESRRRAAGNEKILNSTNTANRVETIERARVKLTEAGIPCRRVSARQAPRIVANWLQEVLSQATR